MSLVNLNQLNISDAVGVATDGSIPVSLQSTDNLWSSNHNGSVLISSGTTAQRESTPVVGYFRYNSDLSEFESYTNASWRPISQLTQDGAVGSPSRSFISDTDTGSYLISDGIYGISAAGTLMVQISNSVITITDDLLVNGVTGSSAAQFELRADPALTSSVFFSDSGATEAYITYDHNTNILGISGDNTTDAIQIANSTNDITFLTNVSFEGLMTFGSGSPDGVFQSTGGFEFNIDTDNNDSSSVFKVSTHASVDIVQIDQSGNIQASLGLVGTPAYSFIGQTDSGIYFKTTPADAVTVSIGGQDRFEVANLTTSVYNDLQGADGLVGAPSFSFNNDTDTGIWRPGDNIIAFSVAGGEVLRIEADGTLSVAGTTDYETLVTADDDIPNKKYIDDLITGGGVDLQVAYDTGTSPEIVVDGTRGAVTIQDNAIPINAPLLELQNNGGGTTYFSVTGLDDIASGTATGLLSNIGDLTITGASTSFHVNEFNAADVTAATAQTINEASTVYISGAPTGIGAGPATITNAYALFVDGGTVRFDGAIQMFNTATIQDTASPSNAPLLLVQSNGGGTTYFDITGIDNIASGTATGLLSNIGDLTITGASTSFHVNEFNAADVTAATAQTISEASTVYISGAPTGIGVGPATITDSYAIFVDAGDVRFDGLVLFGGTSSSFPALKQSSTNLQARLADDSGFTNVEANFFVAEATTGITASATQTQGQQPLTTSINEVSIVGTTNDVVTLPSAVAGRDVTVINNGANTLQIYPASGNNLGAGVDSSTTLAAGSTAVFRAWNSTNWTQLI